ncbi:uncharacterized protein [Asterias amurensis]|uniref:uncharacterized protein n=1 Tax=Asterias amurensis TaxID=7602 RepID=UPI003AB1659D
MAQFSGLSGGGVALPIGVLVIVLTMAFSPVTGQWLTTSLTSWETDTTSTPETYTCADTCAENECVGPGEDECTECRENFSLSCPQCDDDDLDPGDTNCTCVGECLFEEGNEEGLSLLPILIVVGVALFVLVSACCICRLHTKYRMRSLEKTNSSDPGQRVASSTVTFQAGDIYERTLVPPSVYVGSDKAGSKYQRTFGPVLETSYLGNDEFQAGDIYEGNLVPPSVYNGSDKAGSKYQRLTCGQRFETTYLGRYKVPPRLTLGSRWAYGNVVNQGKYGG